MQIHGPIDLMVAKAVDRLPEPQAGPWRFEPKLDGFRALAKIADHGSVRLISRRGTRLDDAFPEIVASLYAYLPSGTILDGELVPFHNGRIDFSALQRRYAQRRRARVLARTEPAHYVVFDVLESPGRGDLRRARLSTRRRVLERLMNRVPTGTPLALVMQTEDPDTAQLWCSALGRQGCEGLVIKHAHGLYLPRARSRWLKYKIRDTAEAVVGGVTGRLRHPTSLILGRYDTAGRLRVVGRTTRLTDRQASEIGPLLTRARGEHPWPDELTLTWRNPPSRYIKVEPEIVVEIHADVAVDHGRWRHSVRYIRPRLDAEPGDVPLVTETEAQFPRDLA